MPGFEPSTFGIGSNLSYNCATTTDLGALIREGTWVRTSKFQNKFNNLLTISRSKRKEKEVVKCPLIAPNHVILFTWLKVLPQYL